MVHLYKYLDYPVTGYCSRHFMVILFVVRLSLDPTIMSLIPVEEGTVLGKTDPERQITFMIS